MNYKHHFLTSILIKSLPIIAAGSVILATAYAAVQQNYRQSGNDPQIELAEDAAMALGHGYPAAALAGSITKVDMSQSLDPFVMVFDSQGKLIGSSASNGSGAPDMPPAGIFPYVSAHGEDRVTWQISSGQRFASVIVPWSVSASSTQSGYVLVARSIRELEIRVEKLGMIIFWGWIGMIVATLIVVGLIEWWQRKTTR